tara:strand:+ start:48 stop:722 length:675 start_codon:yes stop_codon:yes gene_type:complete
MTFGEAFAKARKAQGPGGIFTWEGKKYTTDRADDKARVTKNNIEKKDEPGDRPPKEWNISKLLKKKKREEEPKELKRVPRSSLRAPERPPRYNIEDILDAIAQVETGGEENPDIARGLAGEIGRYQIKPIQGNWGYGIENIFKNEKDLEDPDIARAQARNILENYTKALGGDQLAGIIAYNRGVTGFNNAYGDGDYMNNEYLTNVLSALGSQGIMGTQAAKDVV